ncbi:lytic transglycosylase domain-containing protein [Arenibaculum pallidiluteum]|uniref:lytic transglycosylase domain-containing protein n=1 Tax=Arenibaculum pallidiluteum TaxID=2812559 RepID=UPI001A972263|nr:lytic transglycosylase domain-containing protein [Arenibaculum pallidiluteum]
MAGPVAGPVVHGIVHGVAPARQAPRPAAMAAIELPSEEAERYRAIFAHQERGDWGAADALITDIKDDRLMGHVEAQRLLHPKAYKASYAELRSWLERYADHPDADRVWSLAQRRMGKSDPRAPRPVEAQDTIRPGLHGRESLERPRSVTPRSRSGQADAGEPTRELKAAIAAKLDAGEVDGARDLLTRAIAPASTIDPGDIATERVRVATRLLQLGRDREALELARSAATTPGEVPSGAHWTAGLAAWSLGQYDRAARHFEALASTEDAPAWDKAAAAYWAARVHGRLRRPAERAQWLEIAAEEPRTFYGLVAMRALGRELPLEFDLPPLSTRHVAALKALPEARRAVALIQVGQRERAERELRRIVPDGDPAVEQALLALADLGGMPGLALTLGSSLKAPSGGLYDAALYPLPPWQPEDGFQLDRALLFAVMRQESRFAPDARSEAGARGLMQLMPETARFIGGGGRPLSDPSVNLAFGQRYLIHLRRHKEIGDNLVMLLAAYNAGPGNLLRWRRDMGEAAKDPDPLLFIERLPAQETRDFVRLVLANYWIYRHRLGQKSSSLDAVAAGRWPLYIARDPDTTQVAFDAED